MTEERAQKIILENKIDLTIYKRLQTLLHLLPCGIIEYDNDNNVVEIYTVMDPKDMEDVSLFICAVDNLQIFLRSDLQEVLDLIIALRTIFKYKEEENEN